MNLFSGKRLRMKEIYLHTRDLSVGYNGRPLIREIRLELARGQIMTLIGPNGAGKSTVLKSIIRQLEPVGGAVYLDGRDMAGLSEGDVARRMSVLMTSHIHPELMTCEDVAATGRYPYTGRLGILSREDREKVAQCLALVHASDLAERDFSRISDGQRQRVLLARALCQEPEVLVLDEPTSFLDIRHCRRFSFPRWRCRWPGFSVRGRRCRSVPPEWAPGFCRSPRPPPAG